MIPIGFHKFAPGLTDTQAPHSFKCLCKSFKNNNNIGIRPSKIHNSLFRYAVVQYVTWLHKLSGWIPGAPLTYFNDGGGPSDVFRSEILAKGDFFGSMKDAGIFLGRKKNGEIFLGCEKRTKGFFGGMLKKVVIFLGRQILKLWFFWVKNMNLCRIPPPTPS